MNRRRFLGSAAGVALGISAGCLSDDADTYATLQTLQFANPTDDAVPIDVRIERADTDEIVYTETREVTADFVEHLTDCVWPDAPLTVHVRHIDGDWNSITTAGETDCMGIMADIQGQRTSFFVNYSECPMGYPDCHTDVAE